MYVTLVHIHVKPENVREFIEATLENCQAAIHEHGNVRFDLLRQAEDPCRFILYEAYETAEDVAAHKGTSHYQIWRDTVADWMASPRSGVVYKGLFPVVSTGSD